MVERRTNDDGDRPNRAQLILVGAVTLALVVIGLTVVLNTILFTDTVTTAVTSQDTSDAAEFDFEARGDVRSLLLRLNHRDRNVSEGTLETNVRRNLTNYTRLLQESYTVDKPAFVNVSYDDATFGQRFVQVKDADFTAPAPSSAKDWTPVDPSEMSDQDVGWLVTEFNVTETNTDPVTIRIENGSKYVEVSLAKADDGGVQEMQVDTERNFGQLENTTDESCVAVRGRVLLDVLRGSSYTGDCQFNATQGMEPPFTRVDIEDGDDANGQFSIVVNQSRSDLGGYDHDYKDMEPCEPSDDADDLRDPCHSPVVWQTNVSVSYGSRTVDYDRSHGVTVYP
jgi:hypothetical protein